MKTVDLTRDLRPWRQGDSVPLPDDLADRLVASGEARNPRPWPPREPSLASLPMLTTPLRPAEAAPRRKTYLTREAEHGRD